MTYELSDLRGSDYRLVVSNGTVTREIGYGDLKGYLGAGFTIEDYKCTRPVTHDQLKSLGNEDDWYQNVWYRPYFLYYTLLERGNDRIPVLKTDTATLATLRAQKYEEVH